MAIQVMRMLPDAKGVSDSETADLGDVEVNMLKSMPPVKREVRTYCYIFSATGCLQLWIQLHPLPEQLAFQGTTNCVCLAGNQNAVQCMLCAMYVPLCSVPRQGG